VTERAPGHKPGPLESELEALWQRVRYRLYTPRYVWRWLDLRRRFELRFVRTRSVTVMVPRGLVPNCGECLDMCCTGPNAIVSLRLSDIAALRDKGLQRHIVQQRPQADENSASWARLEAEWSVFHRMFPVLERDVTQTCALLDEDRQCQAWPSWPWSCARYPYSLDLLNNRVFLAKGCGSHRQVTLDDVPGHVLRLVEAAVQGYNERVRDVILLGIAMEELHQIGVLQHMNLEGRWAKRAKRLGLDSPPGSDAALPLPPAPVGPAIANPSEDPDVFERGQG